MATNNTRKAEGLGFSIAGFILSIVVVFLVSLLDFIPVYFLDMSIIDLFFPLRFIIVAAIVSGVYSKFRRGGEGLIFSFLIMLAAILVSIFADYIVLVAWAMLSQGLSALDLAYFTFPFYLREYYYIGPTFFFSLELSGIILLVLNIIAYIVASFVFFGTIAVSKNIRMKTQQTEIASGEFLSRNTDADMSNPFVQARMWTERGLISAGHKTNPIYNNQMSMPVPAPYTPAASFAPVPLTPAPTTNQDVSQYTTPIDVPEYIAPTTPVAEDYTQEVPNTLPEDLTKISSASEAVREMWKNNAEDALDEEGNKNE